MQMAFVFVTAREDQALAADGDIVRGARMHAAASGNEVGPIRMRVDHPVAPLHRGQNCVRELVRIDLGRNSGQQG